MHGARACVVQHVVTPHERCNGVECAGVGGLNPLAIGKPCDDGVCRGSYIERRGISREEVTGGARVEDGPTFDGSGIGADCF